MHMLLNDNWVLETVEKLSCIYFFICGPMYSVSAGIGLLKWAFDVQILHSLSQHYFTLASPFPLFEHCWPPPQRKGTVVALYVWTVYLLKSLCVMFKFVYGPAAAVVCMCVSVCVHVFLILCVCVFCVHVQLIKGLLRDGFHPMTPRILHFCGLNSAALSEQQQDDIADKDRQDMVVETPSAPTLTKKQILNTKQLSTPNDSKACLRAHQGKGPALISTRCTCVECRTDMCDVAKQCFWKNNTSCRKLYN